jgi:hypothetical protein
MAAYTKHKLIGSTYGKGIKITSTSSASPNLVHTAISGTTDFDELWLWAYNDHTDVQPVNLTVEFGNTSPTKITMSIDQRSGLYLVCPGLPVQFGLNVNAYADLADKIIIYGYVNRISH